MRAVVVLWTAVLLAAPSSASPMDEPASWIVWSEDEQEFPVPFSADIKSVRAGTTSLHLHLEFAAYDGTALPVSTSEVKFVAVQSQWTSVRFLWDGVPRLWIDEKEVAQGWAVADGSGPAGWHVQIQWELLDIYPATWFGLADLAVRTSASMAGDEATGPDLEFTEAGYGELRVTMATVDPGATVEGPDFGGGASVTLDARGEPLVAYYIYDAERGTTRGIYLARIDGGRQAFVPERIADTKVSRDNGRDAQMRTQVAHDGTHAFVLFTDDPAVDNDDDGPGHLGTPDSVLVIAGSDGWSREDPTPDGASDVGPEDVADLAARAGRVVAAVPVGNDVWIVERSGPGVWREVTRLEGAHNAKVVLDSKGVIHVAYVVYGTEGNLRDGVLYYASESGFEPTKIGESIDAGWENPETDGSFALAVGPRDEVAVLWNDGSARDRDKEQKVTILQDGEWTLGYAPLRPSHGNPQYTMRLGYSDAGVLVAASGYGGTDSLAFRSPEGDWTRTELPRYDVWDMAVTPAGQVYFAYTQPHGGTTVALTAYGAPETLAAREGLAGDAGKAPKDAAAAGVAPAQAPAAGVAALLVLLVAGALASRKPR